MSLPKAIATIAGTVGSITPSGTGDKYCVRVSVFVKKYQSKEDRDAGLAVGSDSFNVACFREVGQKIVRLLRVGDQVEFVDAYMSLSERNNITYTNFVCQNILNIHIQPKEANSVMRDRWNDTAPQGSLPNAGLKPAPANQQPAYSSYSPNDLDDDLPF